MSTFQLKAEKREKLGSLEARRIKKSGSIPAVIYSKNGNINISLNQKEFEQEFFKGNIQTRVVDIEIDNKKIQVIANKIDLDPVSDRPIHVELLNCSEMNFITATPKINFINQDKSPGLKRGGFLHVNLRKIKVACDSKENIPEKIDFDASSLQVGNKIRSENLVLPKGVSIKNKNSVLIASVIGRGKAEEDASANANAAAATNATSAPASPAKTAAKEEKKSDKK